MDMDKTAIGAFDTGEATQMISAPTSNATQMAINVDCPVCRTPNPPSETYCIDCGFLLSSAPETAVEIEQIASIAKLVTTDGTREFPLKPGINTVGRENTDVLLSHNTVSRNHAIITVENGAAWVEDQGSTNGTFVDGSKISGTEKVEMADGCEVMFGSLALKYSAPEVVEVQEPEYDEAACEDTDELMEEIECAVCDEEIDESVRDTPALVGKLVSIDGLLSFDVQQGANSIGRRQGENDIVITDPYCSGRHARLDYADGVFTITDIGSTNGTKLNGAKLDIDSPHELRDGDEIAIGNSVFRLEVA